MPQTTGTRLTLPVVAMAEMRKDAKKIRREMRKNGGVAPSSSLPSYGEAIFAEHSNVPTLERFRKVYITAQASNSPRNKVMTVDSWTPKTCDFFSRGKDFKAELYEEVNSVGLGGAFLSDSFPKLSDIRRLGIVAKAGVPIISSFTKVVKHQVEAWELLDDGHKDHWFNFVIPVYDQRHKSDCKISIGNADEHILFHRLSDDPSNESDWYYERDGYRYMWRRSIDDNEDFFLTRKPFLGDMPVTATEEAPAYTEEDHSERNVNRRGPPPDAFAELIAQYWGMTKKLNKSEGMLEFVDEGPDGPYITADMKKEAVGGLMFILEMLHKR